MNREIIKPDNHEHWLTLRNADITSTECAALFGVSPYMTEFELFHKKAGDYKPEFQVNDRILWGNRLESAIAFGVAEDYGLIVEPFKDYVRLPELRIGSSFDFRVIGLDLNYQGDDETYRNLFRDYGVFLMEVKNVDGLQFKRGWIEGDEPEAPLHIEMQMQHQMLVSGYSCVMGAALIGGNRPVVFHRLANPEAHAAILEKCEAMWKRVAENNPPTPDFGKDGSIIATLNTFSNDDVADMSDNDRLNELCSIYNEQSGIASAASKLKDAAKAEMLTIIGATGKVMADGFKISAGTVQESYVEGYMRKAYRNVRVTKAK